MLEQLASKDSKWRDIALRITDGDKSMADEIVQEMYIRRYDNNRGQEMTEYYIALTMKSIFLNHKKTERLVPTEELLIPHEGEPYELDDNDSDVLLAYKKLSYIERELIELTYDHSLREIQEKFNINYGYVHRIVTGARKKVLGDRIDEYQNKRLKHMKSKGLGDTVAKITKVLGIKKLVSKITKDCGCEERKELLNDAFQYKLKPRCLTPEELLEYGSFIKRRTFKLVEGGKAVGKVQPEEIKFIYAFYDSIFNTKSTLPTCSSCAGTAKRIITMVTKLDTVYVINKK